MTDSSIPLIYETYKRQKLAVSLLENELEGLKRAKERLIASQSPRDVKAVCYDPNKGGNPPLTEEQFFNKLLELTDGIRRVEEDLSEARETYKESLRLIRKTAEELKEEDRTMVVFQKSVIEGKSIQTCAAEMSVSPQTVSYHRTLIYRVIENEDQTGN